MNVAPDQLRVHLARGLAPIYTVCGDELLQAQEAGDAIRQAARASGCDEREVFHVAGAHVDWSAILGAAQAPSLFSARRLIELRIPSGKPGKDGGEALQRYCQRLPGDVVTLVQLPRLDRQQQQSAWFGALDAAGVCVRVENIERRDLPRWLAQRLAAQGQRVEGGEPGQRALAYFADCVEGNLLAAHQELQKLALLHPPGELGFEQIEAAVIDVARFEVFKLGEAVLAGQPARALRMLDGLRAEGEAAVLVAWTLGEDARALRRVREAIGQGRPLPMALREARVWGAKERLVERLVQDLSDVQAAGLVAAASRVDGITKGLRHPDWPAEPWDALRRLVLMMVQVASGRGAPRLALRA
jgi:DNA polymerase-3 subunit delta